MKKEAGTLMCKRVYDTYGFWVHMAWCWRVFKCLLLRVVQNPHDLQVVPAVALVEASLWICPKKICENVISISPTRPLQHDGQGRPQNGRICPLLAGNWGVFLSRNACRHAQLLNLAYAMNMDHPSFILHFTAIHLTINWARSIATRRHVRHLLPVCYALPLARLRWTAFTTVHH